MYIHNVREGRVRERERREGGREGGREREKETKRETERERTKHRQDDSLTWSVMPVSKSNNLILVRASHCTFPSSSVPL